MRTKLFVTALVIVFLLVGLAVSSSRHFSDRGEETNETTETPDKVPSFALPDYEGNIVRPSDFPGRVLVINSWAVWCPFCRDELPDFAELQREFGDNIVVIAINRAESREKAKGYTDEIGVTDAFVFLLDEDDSFYQSIGGFGMPETIFVDRDGSIQIHKRGPMPFEEMREHTLQALVL